MLALVGVFIYVGVSSYNGVPFEHYRTLTVKVPDIGNLIQHDPVRIAGVRVGQVTAEQATATGTAAVTLQIDPGTRIPVGTRVMVRTNGLLGARYVQLIPSRSRQMLADGATLVGGPGSLTDGVPEALDTFDAATRRSLGQMLRGLGLGVLGRGTQLNDALADAPTAASNFTLVAGAILARPGAASRLLPALDSTMAPLAAVRAQISAMLTPASQALGPLVSERSQLRQSLTDAPPALQSTATGLQTGETLLASADALAVAAHRTLPVLPHGLTEATALLRSSPTPLARARTLLDTAVTAIPAALKFTGALAPVLPPLRDALTRLAPMLVTTGQHGCDLENLGVTLRSMTGFGGTGTGPLGPPMEFRAQIAGGPEALDQFGTSTDLRHEAYAPPCTHDDRPASVASVRKGQP